MKKAFALLMALVMTLSLVSMAYADGDTVNGSWDGTSYATKTDVDKGNEFDVTADITKDDGTLDDSAVYCVDIAWTMTPAAYKSAGATYKWDPTTLKYVKDSSVSDEELTAVTEDASVSITVTNKSNADVKYAIAYASKKAGTKEISVATSTSAASGKLLSAAPASNTVVVTGSPEDTVATGTATSITYTSTVKLATDTNNKYIATKTSAGDLTMGTYTVTISNKSYSVKLAFTNDNIDTSSHLCLYQFNNGDNAVELLKEYDSDAVEAADGTNIELTLTKDYLLVLYSGGLPNGYISGSNISEIENTDVLDPKSRAIILNFYRNCEYSRTYLVTGDVDGELYINWMDD